MENSGISAANRADFNWVPLTDVLTGAAKWFGEIFDQLPVNYSYFIDSDGNKRSAVGLTGNLSIADRLSVVRKLADLNSSTTKTIAKFFPTASIGGAVSLQGPDIEDALKLDIGLPPVLDHALAAWENGLALGSDADFTIDPHLTLEVHDSTNSADPESAIDTLTKYSAGISLSFKGGEVIDGSISYESAMRFIHIEINGEMRTIVADHRTVALDADQGQLAAAGVDLNKLASDGGTWYFYDFNTHQPVELSYNPDTNMIVPKGSATDLTADIKALDPNNPDVINQVITVVGHRPSVPEAMTGQTSDGRYINVSTGRSEYDDGNGTKIISVGARGPDQASSQLVEHTDGSRDLFIQAPGDIFGTNDQTYDVHIDDSGVTINGVLQQGDFAKALSEYSDALGQSDKDAPPPVVYATPSGIDFRGFGATGNRHTEFRIENGIPVEKISYQDGASYWVDVQLDQQGRAVQTDIHFSSQPFPVEFSDAGAAIGETLGTYLAKGDVLTSVVLSSTLKTLGDNFGDAIDGIVGGENVASAFDDAFGTFDSELLKNLKGAGIGAISSFLAAELVGTIGIHGEAGVIANSAASFAINSILTNIANGSDPFAGFTQANLANIENFAGAFVGTQLANAIGDWDEIGEQLGSSVGSTLGAIAGQSLIQIPGIGAAIGAFIGDLIGGLIGGLFTGKPESGAIVSFDAGDNAFAVASVWKNDGGKKAVARSLGNTAADAINGIIQSVGGIVINGAAVDGGSYGMRAKSYIYWKDGTSSDNRVKFDTAQDLLSYGVMQAAEQMQFIGGDVFAKRAFYNTISRGIVTSTKPDSGPSVIDGVTQDTGDFTKVDYGLDLLLGNLDIAQRLEVYLNNTNQINAMMASEPDSVFTAEWMLVLSQASDLGLLKRNAHDWDGGLSYFFGHAGIDARQVTFSFEPFNDGLNGERVIYVGTAAIGDTIDSAGKTVIQGGAGDDYLTAASRPHKSDQPSADSPAHIANVFQGGLGDDTIVGGDTGDDLFGGEGNDVLVGGALDDWLIGGAGDDVLDAAGGNANVLSGGDGKDFLLGADTNPVNPLWGGSDWLQGDDGNDRIFARGGDDYISGDAGDDWIDGGAGNDTVIFRKDDGHDQLSDTGTSTSDHDVLEFGDGIAATDVTVVAHSSGVDLSLLVDGVASGDRIDLRGAVTNLGEGVEEVSFTGGSWSKSDIASHATFAKTAGSTVHGAAVDETLNGTVYDDTLNGGGGHDTLRGGDGSDTYLFDLGDGRVTIDDVGSAVDVDAVVFGAGISLADISVSYDPSNPGDIILSIGSNGDTIRLKHQDLANGSNSIEELRFQDGTRVTLRDIARMGTGAAFQGSLRDAVPTTWSKDLNGGNSNDAFAYQLGDGDIRISDGSGSSGDVLSFGPGIRPEDLILSQNPADARDVWIRFRGHAGSVLLNDQDNGGSSGIDQFQFADGTTWSRATLMQAVADHAGSFGPDRVQDGSSSTNIVSGDGDDVITAGDGADTIVGGRGNDDLSGGTGGDTYVYNPGDGYDRIAEVYNGSGVDTLSFGAGIAPADIRLSRDPSNPLDIFVGFANAPGRILLQNQSNSDGVEQFRFADGTIWDKATIEAMLAVQASSSGNDIVRDGLYVGAIDAGAGNDVIADGDAGNTIIGGQGNDDINGGRGGDTYVYSLGDGYDRIAEAYNGNGTDVLQFGAGIAPDDILLTRNPLTMDDIYVGFAGAAGSIFLQNQSNTSDGIEEFHFSDGTVWNKAAIEAHIVAQSTSAGNDIIRDSSFVGTVDGGAGNDVIVDGGAGNTIIGGLGNDDINGGTGGDTYIYNLGDGDDRITEAYNGNGTDTLQFGSGIAPADIILSRDPLNALNIYVSFANASGSILLQNQSNSDGVEQFRFADGTIWNKAAIEATLEAQSVSSANDIVRDGLFVGTVDGGAGDDVIVDGGAGNTIIGGLGNDDLSGGGGADTYVYNLGDGNDRIVDPWGSGGTDVLQLGAGIAPSDLIVVRRGQNTNDVLIGFNGLAGSILLQDQLTGNGCGIEEIHFADGTVLNRDTISQLAGPVPTNIAGSNNADVMTGTAGSDRLIGNNGDDTLAGGAGNDYLAGGFGNDTYLFNLGDGLDTILDSAGIETLRFGAGIAASDLLLSVPLEDGDVQGLVISIAGTSDQVYIVGQNNSGNTIERFEFADGTVLTNSDLYNLLMQSRATAGDDLITGTVLADTLNGGAGDDEINGGQANDTLTGGTGNDFLNGGSGDDTYIFSRGDGSDTIYDDNGSDTLRFGAGIAPSDLILSPGYADGDSQGLIITIAGGSGRIYIRNQNSAAGHGIERFEFADGTVLTDADLRATLMQQATTVGADHIQGTGYDDTINGGTGADEIFGGNGNDIITGGSGNDYLNGGYGRDTYIFNRGDGFDTIVDDNDVDTLRFGTGITINDLILSPGVADGDSQGLIISIAGTTDRIYICNQNNGSAHTIENFEFADGTVLTAAEMRARLLSTSFTNDNDSTSGTAYADVIDTLGGDDEISAGSGNDVITGGKGNDYIDGGYDNDTYIFNRGDGSDTIYDGAGNDTLQFDEGIDESDVVVSRAMDDGDTSGLVLSIKGTQDQIYIKSEFSGNRIDTVRFKSGASWDVPTLLNLLQGTTIDGSAYAVTMGDDTIVGASTNDTIRGMKGDDALRGGAGSDTYIFARGDGHDVIYDPTDAGSTDTLVLQGISPADVKIMVSPTDPDDLILYVDDDNVIYLDEQNVSSTSGIEQVQFSDGTVWTRAMLADKASGIGTAGDDRLVGSNFADSLQGGAGNDTLVGGAGNDTYVYNAGDGDDTIIDDNAAGSDPRQAGSAGNGDTLSFGQGIHLADLRLAAHREGGPLVLSFASMTGSITLDGLDPGGRSGVELLHFADGTTATMDQLRASTISASETNGEDIIEGFGTDDVLAGGAGNDQLSGVAGSDTYMFGVGDGSDTIIETADGATNRLVLGSGIAVADVRLTRTADAPDDLVVILSNGIDQVTVKDQFAGSGMGGIQQVQFADGTVWQSKDFQSIMLAQPATSGADYLVGDDGDNTIDGLAGNDTIIAAGGNDTIYGSDGDDTIDGGAGDDKLYGGAGDDILSGNTGTDLLDGGDGFDIADYSFSLDKWSIDLGAGKATIVTSDSSTQVETLVGIEGLIGGLGSDTLIGSDGSNKLQGGGGNDTLAGAGGDDVFVFDGDEDGVDSIDGGTGNDRIEAASDGTVIGLTHLASVELITAQGHSDVTIEATDDADTLDLSGTQLDGIVSIKLGAGNDIITSSLGGDVINAGDGDDVIRYVGVSTGADQVDGGAGNDVIQAGADGTVIRLASFQNVEQISGGGYSGVVLARTDATETTDLSAFSISGIASFDLGGGDDTFVGTAQADAVSGGTGHDTLSGAAGDDTYLYAAGDGDDVIVDYAGGSYTNGGNDTLRLGTGIGIGDVAVAHVGNDAILTFAQGGSITLRGQFGSDARYVIEQLQFADGTSWSAADIATKAVVFGTDGNDQIGLPQDGRIVRPGHGDDQLSVSGTGGDTIIFAKGDGHDTLNNPGSGYIRSDVLALIDANPNDVQLTRSGDSLDITIPATGDKFHINYQFWGNGVEQGLGAIRFADGTVWDRSDLLDVLSRGGSVSYTAGNDLIAGTEVADVLHGGGGNDTIAGNGGNDILHGDAGDDSLSGGAGSDTAAYLGAQSSYSLSTSGGIISITDDEPGTDGDDGTDTLVGIETLRFKDGSSSLASPIVLDLNGDGVHLVDQAVSGTRFDWNGDGQADRTGWISKGDALLAFDRNGDGTVSGADELSFVNDVAGAQSDLAGLAAFDGNHDGRLSATDDAWARFGVWSDVNGDGKVDPGEFLSMSQASISSIDLTGTPTKATHELGDNLVVNTGSFTRNDGSTGSLDDIAFSYGDGVTLPIQSMQTGGPARVRIDGNDGLPAEIGGSNEDNRRHGLSVSPVISGGPLEVRMPVERDTASATRSEGDAQIDARRFIEAHASFIPKLGADLEAANQNGVEHDRPHWSLVRPAAQF